MFITEEELNRRLLSAKNLAVRINKTIKTTSDRTEKVKILPMTQPSPAAPIQIQKTVAGLKAVGESTKNLAKEFNLTPAQVQNYANKYPCPNSIERLRELALEKTMIALGLMTQEKFENASLKDLSSVAANLSRVIEKTSPRDITNAVAFVVHAPLSKSLSSYEVIDV